MIEYLAQLTSGSVGLVFALLLGTLVGFFAGLIPGIGGRIGIILSLPIATFWDPLGGAVFLFAMHSVVHTSTSIPAIAFALPSTGSDAATVLDGYPLAKMGRAGEALGASLSASAAGGVLGALAFLICIPIARPLMVWFGPPEFLLLAVAGLAMVSLLAGRNIFSGILVATCGFLAAMVGLDVQTSQSRLTLGIFELVDGLNLAAIIGGLFVVPEMLARMNYEPNGQKKAISTSVKDVFEGMWVMLNHKRLTVRSSLYGIIVGLMPGLGSSVSVWMSYAYAAANTKSKIPFGKGAIAGVIAPEAANNSKEGGSMVPSLFFGIPGSSSMAIMLGAFVVIGLPVGPELLTNDIHIPLILAGTVLLANLLVVPMFFAVVPSIVRFAALQRDHLVPFAIAISVFAALYQNLNILVLGQFVVAGAFGLILRWANWSRAPFILGFVMGPLAEISFIQTSQIWGWGMFARPATIVLSVLFLTVGLRSFIRQPKQSVTSIEKPDLALASFMLLGFAIALTTVFGFPEGASRFPFVICLLGLGISSLMIALYIFGKPPDTTTPTRRFDGIALALLFCIVVPILGLPIASMFYVGICLNKTKVAPLKILLWSSGLAAAQVIMLHLVFDIRAEPLITGLVFENLF